MSISENITNMEDLVKDNQVLQFDGSCVRKVSNWSKASNEFKFDKSGFNPEALNDEIKMRSPKLYELMKNIEKLDENDMRTHGKHFKHFIFSDIKSSSHGAKLLAAVFLAKGLNLGYSAKLKKTKNNDKDDYEKITLLSDNELSKTHGNNFYLLSSVSVYNQDINVPTKKSILSNFNRRPDNVYGKFVRFIIMDSGFKEGIDLFDIKYIHIFEPQITGADQKQVIGRGTRTCGQKGLVFHPTKGWPLYVFKYDIEINAPYQKIFINSTSAFDLYLKSVNIDLRLLNLSSDIERVTVYGSVDYDLNKNIHNFSIGSSENDAIYGGAKKPKNIIVTQYLPTLEPFVTEQIHHSDVNFENMRKYIKTNFDNYAWDDVKMENHCGYAGPHEDSSSKRRMPDEHRRTKSYGDISINKFNKVPKKAFSIGGGGELIHYSPTQDFVRHYFTPQNPLKGILLWHSVGTGKTCSAIAAASSTFEQYNYTIIWVTRTTLKNDIWKNMFDQVCNEKIRNDITNGLQVPDDQSKRMKLLSKSWGIRPMSYKQFSNLVSKKNDFYKQLVKKNGALDPLQKTLLIIDEAHKLYGETDLSTLERPDMDEFHKALMNSYVVSGKNSVKLMLMTATPITSSPLELVKLLNLCKMPDQQMPIEYSTFSEKYLNENGEFTNKGEKYYLDDIAGHVSYLNREKDARQFSQPIIKNVLVPIADEKEQNMITKYDNKFVLSPIEENVNELKDKILATNNKLEGDLSDLDTSKFNFLKKKCDNYEGKPKTKCLKTVRAYTTQLLNEAKGKTKEIRDEIKKIREELATIKVFKTKQGDIIKQNIADNPAQFERFKNSIYFRLKNKCGKKIKDIKSIANFVQEHPAIIQIEQEIQDIDTNVENLKKNLDVQVISYKNRIRQIKELLKTDLNDLERSVTRMILRDEQKKTRKFINVSKVAFNNRVIELNNTKKSYIKNKTKYIGKIRKTMKLQLKQSTKDKKKTEKEEKKLRKTRRKQGELGAEIQDEFLQELVDKYSVIIDKGIQDLEEEMEELQINKEQKVSEKLAKKEEKKQEKEEIRLVNATRKKQEKEEIRLTNATRKKQEKEEIRLTNAARKKQEKEEIRLTNATRKKQEKETEKQEKEAEKLKKKLELKLKTKN